MEGINCIIALTIFMVAICMGGGVALRILKKSCSVRNGNISFIDVDSKACKAKMESDDILDYRLDDEHSTMEQKYEAEGINISDVLEQQQGKVDSDFEYLGNN